MQPGDRIIAVPRSCEAGAHLREKVREIQRSKGLLMRATGCQSAMRQMMTERSSAWLARKVPTCVQCRVLRKA